MEKDRRRYLREYATSGGDAPEITIEGEVAQLINFSTGGLYIRTKSPLALRKVNIAVNSRNNGKMKLTGWVVRATEEGEGWNIAIDLTKQYSLKGKDKASS